MALASTGGCRQGGGRREGRQEKEAQEEEEGRQEVESDTYSLTKKSRTGELTKGTNTCWGGGGAGGEKRKTEE